MVSGRERAWSAMLLEESDRVPMFEIHIDSPLVVSGVLGRESVYAQASVFSRELRRKFGMEGKRDQLAMLMIKDNIELYQKLGLDILNLYGITLSSFDSLKKPVSPPIQISENEYMYVDKETGFYSKTRYRSVHNSLLSLWVLTCFYGSL